MPTDDERSLRLFSAEDCFARNLRLLLHKRGMSQEEFAQTMTYRGHSWRQATVYKVLNQTRGVGLGEAATAAAIFGVPVNRMAAASYDFLEVSDARAVHRKLTELRDTLAEQVAEFDAARRELDEILGTEPWFSPDGDVLKAFDSDEFTVIGETVRRLSAQVRPVLRS